MHEFMITHRSVTLRGRSTSSIWANTILISFNMTLTYKAEAGSREFKKLKN